MIDKKVKSIEKDEHQSVEKIKVANLFIVAVAVAAVLIFFAVFYSYVDTFGTVREADREAWGQFGDFVGGLTNPLLSFLGLLVLLNTFSMQLREARKTSDSILRQLEVSEKEKFENTFFKLVDRLDAYSEGFLRVANGRRILHAQVLRNLFTAEQAKLNKFGDWKEGLERSRTFTKEVVSRDLDRLSLFARKAVQCLSFLESSTLSEEDKIFYVNFFRDSFHRYEFSIFLSVAFARYPDIVHVVRKYDLTARIRAESFCSVHVAKIFSESDISDVYPVVLLPKDDEV